jgi:hypothetical protein
MPKNSRTQSICSAVNIIGGMGTLFHSRSSCLPTGSSACILSGSDSQLTALYAGLARGGRFGQTDLELASLAHTRVPVVLLADRHTSASSSELTLVVREVDTGLTRRTPLRLLAPH